MAAIGNNYAKRREPPKRSDINKAWAKQRSKAIKQGQQLRQQVSNAVFNTSVTSVQQQTVNAIQQARSSATSPGNYSSPTAVGARINLLI